MPPVEGNGRRAQRAFSGGTGHPLSHAGVTGLPLLPSRPDGRVSGSPICQHSELIERRRTWQASWGVLGIPDLRPIWRWCQVLSEVCEPAAEAGGGV